MVCNECGRRLKEKGICVCSNFVDGTKHINRNIFFRDRETQDYAIVAKRLNLEYDEAVFITDKYIYQIHMDWIKEYEEKHGYKEAKKYYEDLEEKYDYNGQPIYNKYIYKHKFEEKFLKVVFDERYPEGRNKFAKRYAKANSREEEEQIIEESAIAVDEVYADFFDEIEKFKNEHIEELEEYIATKKKNIEEENKEGAKFAWAILFYIVISHFVITLYGNILKFDFNELLGLKIIVIEILVAINTFISALAYQYLMKLPFIIRLLIFPFLGPIIIFIGIVYIMVVTGSPQAQNERNKHVSERQRQEIIKDIYNKRK